MFKPITLYYSDGYKVGHKRMLAKGTARLYGTWIPRSLKHAPKGVKKIVSFGQQLTVRWLNDEFNENFFQQPKDVAVKFGKDMSLYLGMEYDAKHFEDLHDLGYLPMSIKSLPEGIETLPNIPHMTFINTVDGFGWLTLYLETIISSLSWKSCTAATIALQYRRNLIEWIKKTDENNMFLADWLCHDFSARGLDPFSMLAVGLGHAASFRGSDTIICIPGARYFYDELEDEVCINSVNASEHSVSTTKIFTVGEKQMIIDWLKEFPTGILSIVADTFDLWKLIIEYLQDPEVKALIMARDGKLVIRPDSGDPVDIICGEGLKSSNHPEYKGNDWNEVKLLPKEKGVIELLWDIFGGTINDQGYKILDSHIGAIYGDSITLDRQLKIYERLANKDFACTNIVLGIGSYTYQMVTRDTLGFAAKGAWFEIKEEGQEPKGIDIYKDPVTDDGTKKSAKGFCGVFKDIAGEYYLKDQLSWEESETGELQEILRNSVLKNQTTLTEIRERISKQI
jgi:nicotinamide phosphoribosyltransferase